MIRRLAVASVLLAACATAAFAQPPSPDLNKDGFISRAEHVAASNRGFARMDQNKDGAIGPEEQAKVARMMGGRNILAPADFNKDGKVSREEFTKASNFRFDQADASKDGKLDRAEQAVLRANRGV